MTLIAQDDAAPDDAVIIQTGDDWFPTQVASSQTPTPGAVVVRDANGDVQEAGAGETNCAGVLPENSVHGRLSADETASLLDDFAAGDNVTVHRGGVIWRGILAQGNGTIANDTLLKPAANGELQPIASGDSPELAVARYIGEADQDTSGSSQRAPCKWVQD